MKVFFQHYFRKHNLQEFMHLQIFKSRISDPLRLQCLGVVGRIRLDLGTWGQR